MTAPEDAIRARRKLTNRLIAAHDAPRLRPFFVADVKLIRKADGGVVMFNSIGSGWRIGGGFRGTWTGCGAMWIHRGLCRPWTVSISGRLIY